MKVKTYFLLFLFFLAGAVNSIAQVVTTSPSIIVDSTESVTITFHPYADTLADYGGHSGDTLLRHFAGNIYIYTGILPHPTPGAGDWIHTNTTGWGASDTYYEMTRVDSNTYVYTFPNLRAYYALAGTDTVIDSIALIFTSGNGDTQTSNIYLPVASALLSPPVVGHVITTNPTIVTDSIESVTITFHPFWDTLKTQSGDSLLRYASGPFYIYTGVLISPSVAPGNWFYTNTTGWGASDPYYRMTEIDSNDYSYTIPDIRSYYTIAGDTTHIDSIALIFTTGNGDLQTSNVYIPLVWSMHSVTSVPNAVATINHTGASMQLLPNPATDQVSIITSLDDNSTAEITLINQVGQCVLNKTVNNQNDKLTVFLNELPNGVYFVQLVCGSGKIIQKLIKE